MSRLEKDISRAIRSSPTGWTNGEENQPNESEWCDIQEHIKEKEKEAEKISVGTNTEQIQPPQQPNTSQPHFDTFTYDIDLRFRENRTREVFSEVERTSNIFSMFDISIFTVMVMSIYAFIKKK
jgi:hypothetical protein